MKTHNKVNQTLALALSIATLSSSFSGTMAYAQGEKPENGTVQSQAQEMGMYFQKPPVIGDTKLHVNTKKLKDDKKLVIGDRLQMKLITGGETYKKILVDSVKEEHIKEDYITEQVMGSGGRPLIPYREFSAGDRIELYVVKGNRETQVGNLTVKGEKSLEPIVEQTKDKIMMSPKMTGSIKMFLHTKKDNTWKIFDFEKDKKDVAGVISYDFPMEKLREKYGASVGDEFVVVHQESGKGKSISKKMVLKGTYDEPSVEFKERKDAKDRAGYTISLPDNSNLDPTAIQKHLPKLKVVKGNEAKTFTLNKTSMPGELQPVKEGVFYAVPKNTPNNTKFEFSQEGENFNSSKPVTMTYQVDMSKATPLYDELKSYPVEEQEKFNNILPTIKSNLEKQDRTQEQVDNAAQALESIILPKLRDSLGPKRQEANKAIEGLKHLDRNKKRAYQAKVTGAKSEQEINGIVEQAKAENKQAEDEKNLKQVKAEVGEKINKLTDLTEGERKGFIDEVERADSAHDVETIYQKAQDKSIENQKAKAQEAEEAAKALDQQRKEALEMIKALPGLANEQFAQAESELKAAGDKTKIDEIVNNYKMLSEVAMKKKGLDDAKQEYMSKLETLSLLSADDKERFTKEIQEADTLDLVKEIFDGAVQFNLSKAQAAALDKVTEFKNLSDSEINSAINEIKATKEIAQIEPIVEKYKKLDQEKVKPKTELETARKDAIAAIKQLSHLTPEEIARFEGRINGAGSANEIKDIRKEAVRKNKENLSEKNKAQTLDAAKKELGALIQEAKAIKLSKDSKLKEKFENTLKTADEALKGHSLDAMNAATQDLKRLMEDVKKEQEQAPGPQDPKKPSPSEPAPTPKDPKKPTPAPNNPKQPNPSRPKPSTESKRKENSGQRSGWINLTFERKTPPKGSAEQRESNRKSTQNYIDIENHWAKEAINYSLEHKLFDDIATGNRFEPNKAMTRAEFIAVLGRFEGAKEFPANISFQDIDMNAYYAKYVNWAKANGLIYGMDATNFAPNKAISREEMATILYRYKQMKKINFDGKAKQFKDGDRIPKWAREAVKEVSKSNIINGMEDGTFQGKKQLSRAEIAQIVFNINKIR